MQQLWYLRSNTYAMAQNPSIIMPRKEKKRKHSAESSTSQAILHNIRLQAGFHAVSRYLSRPAVDILNSQLRAAITILLEDEVNVSLQVAHSSDEDSSKIIDQSLLTGACQFDQTSIHEVF